MARATEERSGLEGWLYRLGYVSARMGGSLRSAQETASGMAERSATAADDRPLPGDPDSRASTAETLDAVAATTAAGALVAQLLRPRRVNWPRAILAGTMGTLVYDAETIVESRLLGRKFSTSTAPRRLLAEGGLRRQLARYAAGIAMAGFYARYLHGRLPGPPLLQGLLYGLLEAGTHAQGGPVALLARVAPDAALPDAYTHRPAPSGEPPLRLLRRHVMFGLVVGMIYTEE